MSFLPKAVKTDLATGFLSVIGINLLASNHECRSLIGNATHYLFCCAQRGAWQCVVKKMAAASLRFRSVSEGAADKVLNNQYLELPCDTNLELRMY